MRYNNVNSNRSRNCAKMNSVLSFSPALLIRSCSACQPASSSTLCKFSVLQVVAGWTLTLSYFCPWQLLSPGSLPGCLQPSAGEVWGQQGSAGSSSAGRHKLMLTMLQACLPNQGRPVLTVNIMPNPMTFLKDSVSYQCADLGHGAQSLRSWKKLSRGMSLSPVTALKPSNSVRGPERRW